MIYESLPHAVTEKEIIEFARHYDPQYFHLDAEAAKDSIFGGIVCGGFQTAALAWALAFKSSMFDDCSLAGIGIDELCWLEPVRPGNVLRCRFTMNEWRPSGSRPEAGVCRMRFEMVNQDDRPVMTMVMIQLLRRRSIRNP
ncbi:MAG TPA: MaoC/PaaZ C-terminal domain-containing protein [Rhodocyclaceae bacterium]|nr:MaoC/PaaZ C-terminal domain-containing protein [Rhodocyclaceae bacterium]